MSRAGVILAIAGVLAACDPSEATLVVQVRADLAPGIELASVRVEVATTPLPTTIDTPAGAARDWGRGVRVAELALAPGTYSFRVAAIGPDGATVVERRVRAEVTGGVRVATVLLTRDCAGVTCPGPGDDAQATECAGGRCVLATCIEEDSLSCGDAECASPAECDVPAEACVIAECTTSGTCFASPDHARCGADEVCVVGDGCVRADGSDAGAGDAGGADAGDAGGADAGGADAGPGDGGLGDAGLGDAGLGDAGVDAGIDAGADAAVCPSPCGLLPQCGCMGGESCTYLPGVGATCTPSGPGVEGDPCTEHLDCAAGHDCFFEHGRCLPYCLDTAAHCRSGRRCAYLAGASVGICLGDSCDVVLGAGCAAGETCRMGVVLDPAMTPYRQTFCSPAGSVPRSRACAYANDCVARHDCHGGTCAPYCATSADCGGSDSFCIPPDTRALAPPGICTDSCDLLAGTGCGPGRSCRLASSLDFDGSTMLLVKQCDDVGAGARGAACTRSDECARGLSCVGSQCLAFCDRATSICSVGSCTALGGDPTIDGVVYGACL